MILLLTTLPNKAVYFRLFVILAYQIVTLTVVGSAKCWQWLRQLGLKPGTGGFLWPSFQREASHVNVGIDCGLLVIRLLVMRLVLAFHGKEGFC